MQQNQKFVLTPIAAAVTAAVNPAAAIAAEESSGAMLEEVVVTARKRTESVQDIPASVQALGQEQIEDMGAQEMADYARFVPSVNVVTYQNGSSTVVFRGATTDGGGSYIAQTTSSVYLDEISVTSTGAQPGIRMVDIARVEALAGPQGTIYGSDAQAGTMRIVTNKPVMNEFSAQFEGSVREMSEGEGSYEGSIMVNMPIVEDKLALRLVGFKSKDGGFIDNVFGYTPDTVAVDGLVNELYGALPDGFGTLDNAHVAENDWNDSEISGWRASLKWDINDNWSATLMALHQKTESGAANDFDPYVGDLETVRYNEEFRDDEYDIYSLTIEGDLGFAQLVSATSYYDRDIKETIDNTVYHHYWAALYCQTYALDPTVYTQYFGNPDGSGVVFWPVYCHAPTVGGDYLAAYDIPAQQDRFTQEIRLSSQGDTFDWLVGLYYEESTNAWQATFGYPTSNDYQDSISLAYWEWYYGQEFPNARTHWYSSSETEWEQLAMFGEIVWHATDQLDITFGGRYFDRENVNVYFVQHPHTQFTPEYIDGIPEHKGDETEFVPKLSAAYHFDTDSMGYVLWTEGYRPGGTNRSRGEPFFPNNYFPDKMTNYEVGYKTLFLEGNARANLTAFYMDWEDYQLELVDPSQIPCADGGPDEIAGVCGQPWQNIVANAGDAHILGFSMELDWAINENFVIGMNAEWLEAETDSTLDLNGDGNVNVEKGNQLPIVPEIKASAWATYSWPMSFIDSGMGFARFQISHQGKTNSILEPVAQDGSSSNPQFENDAYTIMDFRIGVETPTWELSLFVNNLNDERAHYQHSWGIYEYGQGHNGTGRDHVARIYTNRPREIGLRYIHRFGAGAN